MVYNVHGHLERARNLLNGDDADKVFYALLELRYALERIAYEKLQLRLDKVTIEEIGAWQPRRAMDRLMELVDENLDKSSTLRVAVEDGSGNVDEKSFSTVGHSVGINPRDIGRHWQKISSYLHVRVPRKKGEHPKRIQDSKIREYIVEVIGFIESITKTQFDGYFAPTVQFSCCVCEKTIIRNERLLKSDGVVQCQNPDCDASYVTKIDGENYIFDLYQVDLACKNCGAVEKVAANKVFRLKTDEGTIYTCDNCGSEHLVRWVIRVSLEEESTTDN